MDNEFVVEEDDLIKMTNTLRKLFEFGIAQIVCPDDVTQSVFEAYKRFANVMAATEEVWEAGGVPKIIIRQTPDRQGNVIVGDPSKVERPR